MIDIHESCAQLVAAGYNAVVDNEADDEFFAAIRIFLDDDQHDLLVIRNHATKYDDDRWEIFVTASGEDAVLGVSYVHNGVDVCEAISAYVLEVQRDARDAEKFCARFALIDYFGWE